MVTWATGAWFCWTLRVADLVVTPPFPSVAVTCTVVAPTAAKLWTTVVWPVTRAEPSPKFQERATGSPLGSVSVAVKVRGTLA